MLGSPSSTIVGEFSGNGRVRVKGTGSVLDAGDSLQVGRQARGVVMIGKGAVIRANDICVGPNGVMVGKGTVQGNVTVKGGLLGKKLAIVGPPVTEGPC